MTTLVGRTMSRSLRCGALATCLTVGCRSVEVQNPNDLDQDRIFSDPNTIESYVAGALRTWFVAYTRLTAVTLSTQARTLTGSWNNAEMRLFSSVDVAGVALAPFDTATSPALWTRQNGAWDNEPNSGTNYVVPALWKGGLEDSYSLVFRAGSYASLSAANDVLTAIRNRNVVIRNPQDTRRAETMALLVQGASLMIIALNYDRGFIIDETTDRQSPPLSARKEVRDAAIASLEEAAMFAESNTFEVPGAWTNGGVAYTNTQIRQLARTLAAMALAWHARDASEASSVDWARVESLTSRGMSSGTPVDLEFIGDGDNKAWLNETAIWANAIEFMRVSTRVAHLLDPSTQKDPWPLQSGNARPNSPDKRLGDGSFADSAFAAKSRPPGTIPRTARGGSDFAWSSRVVFPPGRGYYHQSNIGLIRYDKTGVQSPTGVWSGFGPMPVINATVNDLLWAEALLRQNKDLSLAATLINRTRVLRGGLPAASPGDPLGSPADGPCMANGMLAKDGGTCTLFSKLLYEYEIELLSLGAAPFYNQRRLPVLLGGGSFDAPNGTKVRYIQGLIPGTPREMPVPHTELVLMNQPIYTWGGKGPPNSPP